MIYKATVILTALAATCLLVCVVWGAIVGPNDWGILAPLLLWMYVGQVVALAGLVCGIVSLARGGGARAGWMVAIGALLIAGPWLFLAAQW